MESRKPPGVEEAGCKIYRGAPTVNQTTGQIRQEDNSKLVLQWLPYQASFVRGSMLGLAGPESIYCDRVR